MKGVVMMHNLGQVVLVAEVTALQGKYDELRRALYELIPQSLAEGGVVTFRLHEDRHEPGHFTLYEVFRNQHSVDLHVQTDHFARAITAFTEFAQGGAPKIAHYQMLTE
jgi:quinol monooxygenase YgiN